MECYTGKTVSWTFRGPEFFSSKFEHFEVTYEPCRIFFLPKISLQPVKILYPQILSVLQGTRGWPGANDLQGKQASWTTPKSSSSHSSGRFWGLLSVSQIASFVHLFRENVSRRWRCQQESSFIRPFLDWPVVSQLHPVDTVDTTVRPSSFYRPDVLPVTQPTASQ